VVLKALQALLVAVPIVTVYVWTRSLTRDGWAFAAAAMTAALPAFVYSGLIMTEVTFLAVTTLLLWRLWRTLMTPTLRNQVIVLVLTALAVAIRLKAFILVGAIIITVALTAWLWGDRRLLRRFAPTGIVLLTGGVLTAAGALASGHAVLGTYRDVLGSGYNVSRVLHWIAYEAGDLMLLVLGVPVVAMVALTVGALRRREDNGVQALVAVALPYTVLLLLEVGAFISRYELRINERTLISLAPPFFVALAVWLDRGMPRGRLIAAIALGLGVAACFWPTGKLIVTQIVPDSFTPVPLFDLRLHSSPTMLRVAWIAVVAAAVLLPLLLPRRLGAVLVALIVGALLTSSVLAETKVHSRAASDRRMYFGTASPDWVDRAAPGKVAYLDDDPLWAGSWHLAYWNPKLDLVALVGTPSSARPDSVSAAPRDDGVVIASTGQPLSERTVLAPSTMTLEGKRLARHAQGGDEPGLTLWQTPSTPQVSSWVHGVLPQPVTVDVYRCAGELALTATPVDGRPDLFVSAGSLAPAIAPLAPGHRVRLAIPAPPGVAPGGHCTYTIRTDGDVTLSGLSFRRAAAPPAAGATTVVRRLGSTPLPGYAPPAAPPARPKLAYCVNGNFQMLPAGNYPGGAQAVFVEGTGLTCSAPDGYLQQGYAGDGVPPGIYPLYVPPAG
jgi:hypothetical protein